MPPYLTTETANSMLKSLILILCIFSLCACATPENKSSVSNEKHSGKIKLQKKLTFAKDDEFVVLISKKNDSLKSLAKKYLGDENRSWIIADFNNIDHVTPKREIVIPLKPQNSSGVYVNGYQTIPILCYHRFGDTGHIKLTVSEKKFRQQMQYLKDNDYRVIPMRDMVNFISGKKSLPKKAVIITIDDGYRSTYEIAYPILKEFGFPATLFLYTDFTGARDAIKWSHAKKMYESGLMDIQPHSKSHPNMSLIRTSESKSEYRKRILNEVTIPSKRIKGKLEVPLHTFAYPYGDTNKMIIRYLKQNNYALGVTVQPGGNPVYAHPYMLHRTMIFGDHSLSEFKNYLNVFQERSLK
jgi:peptidoglycan/xylan/chitin deacetylase (PgdA/CDA1 family)